MPQKVMENSALLLLLPIVMLFSLARVVDGSDDDGEDVCALLEVATNSSSCKVGEFQCRDKERCVALEQVCNGVYSEDVIRSSDMCSDLWEQSGHICKSDFWRKRDDADCGGGSWEDEDEEDWKFRRSRGWRPGACEWSSRRCDLVYDLVDRSDESGCGGTGIRGYDAKHKLDDRQRVAAIAKATDHFQVRHLVWSLDRQTAATRFKEAHMGNQRFQALFAKESVDDGDDGLYDVHPPEAVLLYMMCYLYERSWEWAVQHRLHEVLEECEDPVTGEAGLRMGSSAAGGGDKTSHIFCLSYNIWCRSLYAEDLPKQVVDTCPELVKVLRDETLCKNVTFWHDRPCGDGTWSRCSGNLPGACFRSDCKCRLHCKNGCPDHSHMTCTRAEAYENRLLGSVVSCGYDVDLYVHRYLMCDGLEQCPLDEDKAADEDPSVCGGCPNLYYPPESSIHCRHRLTGRPICAKNCDGVDDFCEDKEDEICVYVVAVPKIILGLIVGIIVCLILTCASECLFRMTCKKERIDAFVLKAAWHREAGRPQTISLVAQAIAELDLSVERHKSSKKSSKKKRKKAFLMFRAEHEHDCYNANLDQALDLLELEHGEAFIERASRAIYKCEIQVHRGSRVEADQHLKTILGTTDKAKCFYNRVFPDLLWLKTIPVVKYCFSSDNNNPQGNCLFPMVSCCQAARSYLAVVAKCAVYYVDLAKDLLLINLLVSYGAFIRGYYSVELWVCASMIASLLAVEVANAATFLEVATSRLRVGKWWELALCVFTPVLPGMAFYQAARHEFSLKLCVRRAAQRRTADEEHSDTLKQMRYHRTQRFNWTMTLGRFRRNENTMEHPIQVLALLVMLLLRVTDTRTQHGLQDIVASGQYELLAISAAWSTFTLIRGPVNFQSACKDGFLKLTGILLLALYHLVGVLSRLSAILLFLAPSLGLFDLLWHWKMGSLYVADNPPKIYDVVVNKDENRLTAEPVLFHEAWKPLNSYIELTGLPLKVYSLMLLFGTILHLVAVFFVKLLTQPAFRNRLSGSRRERFFHLLSNSCIPIPFQEWDHSHDDTTFWTRWCNYRREALALLALFASEHLLLCVPVWILTWKVSRRNAFLDEYFPQLEEEVRSTERAMFLAVVPPILYLLAPLLQWTILLLYARFGHPWSRIWTAEMEEAKKKAKRH